MPLWTGISKVLKVLVVAAIPIALGVSFEGLVKVPNLEIVHQEQDYKIPISEEITYIFIRVKNNSGWDSAQRCVGYVTIKSNEAVYFTDEKVSWALSKEEIDILRSGGIEKLYLLVAKKRREDIMEVFLAKPTRDPHRPWDYPAFRLKPGNYDIYVTVRADNDKWWSTPISQKFKLSLSTSWDTLTLAKP